MSQEYDGAPPPTPTSKELIVRCPSTDANIGDDHAVVVSPSSSSSFRPGSLAVGADDVGITVNPMEVAGGGGGNNSYQVVVRREEQQAINFL